MFGNLFSKGNAKKSDEGLNSSQIAQLINDTLANYVSSNFPKGILSVCLASSIEQGKSIVIQLTMPFPCQGELDQVAQSLAQVLNQEVTIEVNLQVKPVRRFALASDKKANDNQALPSSDKSNRGASKIANIIAVASGKGGVGKSTTTVNLAYALIAEGAKVGILDADIYGPSIPTMLGLKHDKPGSSDGKLMTPLLSHGLHAMSIGFLVDPEDATVWRGPMASSAFSQLLNETAWPELDYLLIDMPPGTGDIQLTLAQKVPVAAAVIVTTPQDIALVDAVKGIAMFDKVKVLVLGVIENMSYHLCENCGHQSHIFGNAGGEQMATNANTQLLGQLPLDISIREDADFGQSDIIENSAGEIANHYRKIARNMAGQLFLQCDNASPLTANVNVE